MFYASSLFTALVPLVADVILLFILPRPATVLLARPTPTNLPTFCYTSGGDRHVQHSGS
jgi:hypothetical protein